MMADKRDLLSSFCLFALGLFIAFHSLRLSIWSESGPGEGFFPLLVAFIIIGLSLLIMVKSIFLIRERKNKIGENQAKNPANYLGVILYIIAMVLFSALFEKIGLLITSSLFFILVLKYVENQRLKVAILVGLTSVFTAYFLFVYFLKVPLPRGLIKWL
jgi:putative tricarboxylic transport membrane protein